MEVSYILLVISSTVLIFDLAVLLPIKIYHLRKRMALKQLEPTLSNMIEYALSLTIFTYLDSLDLSTAEVGSRKNTQQSPIRTQTREYKELKALHEYNGEIICSCYDCFCEGCPWESKFQYAWCSKVSDMFTSLQNSFIQYLKYLMFFITKPYLYLLLNNYFAFSRDIPLVTTFGIIFQSLQFYVIFFTFSFISTKREIVRLDKNKEGDRGLLLYYHIRKAFIFTLMLVVLLILSVLVMAALFNDNKEDPDISGSTLPKVWYHIYKLPSGAFICYNTLILLIGNVVMILFMKYNDCLKNDLIQDNDNILKAQQRLYIMQNNLIKYFPSEELFQTIVEETKFDDTQITEQLHEKCYEAKIHLNLSLAANEKQQFKKIKKNLGQQKWAITTLVIYMYSNTYAILILITLFVIFIWSYVSSQSTNSPISTHDLSTQMKNIGKALLAANCLQITAFPILLEFMLDKKSLFGQDYGEWQDEEEKQ